MAMTDKKRKTDYAWQKKNYKRVGCKLYKGDAEAFEEYCRKNNMSVANVKQNFTLWGQFHLTAHSTLPGCSYPFTSP